MVKVSITFSNGDTFAFETEADHLQVDRLVTEWYAQRDISQQATIDALTSKLSAQNVGLASGVTANQPAD